MVRTALASSIAALLAGMAWHTASANIATAARDADLEEVRKLIAAGSDVNQPESDGSSALLWAAHQGSPELVTLLLEAGGDPNAANNFGVTPLLEASRYGDAATIKALLEGGADPAVAAREGETPLMAASRAGNVAAVQLLIDSEVDVNAVESLQEQSALMWAAAEGHLDVVDALLDKGANANLKARSSELTTRSTRADYPSGGFTALHWAVRNGDEAVVRRLVEGGADLNITNADGATPMMLAIVNDRFDLAAKLVELGADANDGSLYYAMEMRDATTDWRARDGSRLRVDHPNQLTALDLAKVLLEAGADPDKPIDLAAPQRVDVLRSEGQCDAVLSRGGRRGRRGFEADAGVRAGLGVGAVVDQDGPPPAGQHRRQVRADGRDERRQRRRHGRRPGRHPRGHRASVPRGQQP